MPSPTTPTAATPTTPNPSEPRRGSRLLELLFAAAVLATTVPVAVWASPKRPESAGD